MTASQETDRLVTKADRMRMHGLAYTSKDFMSVANSIIGGSFINTVGIDVSKKKSTVTICQPGDVVLLPPRDYRHTQSSINELIATIKGLDRETKVCMEHTGRYYEPIASWLSEVEIFVSAVSPKLIKDFSDESLHARTLPQQTINRQ